MYRIGARLSILDVISKFSDKEEPLQQRKLVKRPKKVKTNLTSEVLSKVKSDVNLKNSLASGSKRILEDYQRKLMVSTGNLETGGFDKPVYEVLERYCLNKELLRHNALYLDSIVDRDGYRFSRNLKIYSEISPAMLRFTMPDWTSFRWSPVYQKTLEDLRNQVRALRLHPIHYSCDEDIMDAVPKMTTHSGYYYVESGKKTKGENMDGIYLNFRNKVKSVVESGTFDTPILLGFRTQASGEFEDDGAETGKCKHKLRVVSMVSLLTIIGELMFAKPFQNWLGDQPYYAGKKSDEEIGMYISHWRTKYRKFMSIDYSSFDQTISSWLIEDAFSIIAEAFVMNEEESKIFKAIVNDFIHKDFIVAEGVLHSDRGVPSGSMFTQIIDSLVNVIVVQTFFNLRNVKAEMMAMGDDNIIFTSGEVNITDLAVFVQTKFGLEVKVDDKSNEGLTNQDPKFLSRFWTKDGAWRHINQLQSRLLYPERYRRYGSDVTPEMVVFAFILTYPKGMKEMIDVQRFLRENPISKKYVVERVDSRYLPGSLAFRREYGDVQFVA